MKKSLFLILISFLLLPGWIQAQEDATRYLEAFEIKYSGLKDYTVDVNVHFDIEGFKMPDMHAKIYYKNPDKINVESKKIFLFPKEGGFFSPGLLKKEAYESRLLEHLTYDRRKAVKLRLIPKDTKKSSAAFILTMEIDRSLIREMEISSFEGRDVKAVIEYGEKDGFDLPSRIQLHLDLPFNESIEIKDFGQSVTQRTKRVAGKIEITYSNYKLNSGLRDDIFKETNSPLPKGRPQE